MYCVFPCDTDADCVELSRSFTVPFTHCATQGNLTICQYAAELGPPFTRPCRWRILNSARASCR